MIDVHLFSHKKILVEQVPEKVYVPNVLAMWIYFLLHESRKNHVLIRCLSNRPEWIDSSRCNLDQRESS